MDISFLVKGFVIGLSIAAPVGPIGVLCIRRTLAEGRASGLVSGLGAATADALYGCLAGFGLTAISNFLTAQQVWFHAIGGMFLCYLGIKTFLSRPAEQAAPAKKNGVIGSYGSTFILTLTNPMTILSFIAIFAGLGLGSISRDYTSASLLVAGVFIGSGLWWFVLSTIVSLFQKKLSYRGLQRVNRISGIVITGFGLIAILSLINIVNY